MYWIPACCAATPIYKKIQKTNYAKTTLKSTSVPNFWREVAFYFLHCCVAHLNNWNADNAKNVFDAKLH
jgi:hypothetical protein